MHPTAEGQGLGTQLLTHTLAAAKKAGVNNLVVWTFADNHPARRLYARLGGQLLPETDPADMNLA